MNLIPNIDPKLFSLSAVVVGYLLIDDLTANEQNALGNWLMLVAQVISTNAFYRQVMQERGLEPKTNDYSKNEITNMLEKMVKALEQEINDLKGNNNYIKEKVTNNFFK